MQVLDHQGTAGLGGVKVKVIDAGRKREPWIAGAGVGTVASVAPAQRSTDQYRTFARGAGVREREAEDGAEGGLAGRGPAFGVAEGKAS